jgi:hypothetical protein
MLAAEEPGNSIPVSAVWLPPLVVAVPIVIAFKIYLQQSSKNEPLVREETERR